MTDEDVKTMRRVMRVGRLFHFCTDAETVDARRRDAMQHRDKMLAYQKEAGKARDGDTARFFKGEAQEAMKMYRGACLVLGYLLCDPPGDSLPRRFKDWPDELIPYAERASW